MARAAKSLETLRKQLNDLFPNRSKVSDGGIGDAAHSSRKSDHNPNQFGVFRARDFTHDPKHLDCHALLKVLLASKDSRIKYIIFNGFIYNVKHGFAKTTYKGLNAHKQHLHLSVSDTPKTYDDDSLWNLTGLTASDAKPEHQERATEATTRPTIQIGAKGELVRDLQTALVEFGFMAKAQIDSTFGKKTEQALQRFQLQHGLVADGIAGVNTYEKLGLSV